MDPWDQLMQVGYGALNDGNWTEARQCFERALEVAPSPEAHDGLGLALWWLNELEAAHHHRMIAYRGFNQLGEPGRPTRVAAWLAREQVFLHNNSSAMHGWFARAGRLLDGAGLCPERGWFIILRASMKDAPAELERAAVEAPRRSGLRPVSLKVDKDVEQTAGFVLVNRRPDRS